MKLHLIPKAWIPTWINLKMITWINIVSGMIQVFWDWPPGARVAGQTAEEVISPGLYEKPLSVWTQESVAAGLRASLSSGHVTNRSPEPGL